MSTFIKQRFPCLSCKEPVQVRRVKDGEWARCAHCTEVRRLLFCATHCERTASEWRAKAPKLGGAAEVAAYLRAASGRTEAAAYVAEAVAKGLRGLSVVEERRWLVWAAGRAEWASGMIANTIPLLMRERDAKGHGLIAIPGDGMLPEAPASAPVLRLVGLVED